MPTGTHLFLLFVFVLLEEDERLDEQHPGNADERGKHQDFLYHCLWKGKEKNFYTPFAYIRTCQTKFKIYFPAHVKIEILHHELRIYEHEDYENIPSTSLWVLTLKSMNWRWNLSHQIILVYTFLRYCITSHPRDHFEVTVWVIVTISKPVFLLIFAF